MSDVTVTLNNTEIATLDDTGIARLKTSGKRMDGDVLVQYEKPQTGPDVSGLDAAATDVASGKKFIGTNGEEETGAVETLTEGSVLFVGDHDASSTEMSSWNGGAGDKRILMASFTEDILVRSGAELLFYINKSRFGNATVSDVTAGKTFTGADGVMQTGAAPGVVYGEFTGGGASTYTLNVGTAIAPRIKCISWWCETATTTSTPAYGITPCFNLLTTLTSANGGFKIYKGSSVRQPTSGTTTTAAIMPTSTSTAYYGCGVNETLGTVQIGTGSNSYTFNREYTYKYAILYI